MNISEAMRIALQSLWANKLRSVLTLLGVVIGVSSVIAVVTFVNGINGYVAERVFRYGADVFTISKTPKVSFKAEEYLEALKRKDIQLSEYEAVRDECSACKVVAATLANQTGKIKFGQQSTNDTEVRGWTETMSTVYDLDLIRGRSITDYDARSAAHVVVIGYDIFENLLGSTDPIGKELRVDGDTYTIIGVGKKEGSTFGRSRDNWVMMPILTYQAKYGSHQSIQIWSKAYGVGAQLSDALDQSRVILRTRRHDLPGKPDSFEIATNDTFLSIWSSISQNFFLVTIAIASISLIVGGIVIMNIMLVSVTERTREIGIRKALGARRADVMSQFLIESGTISLVGGVLGIVLGIVVAKTVTLLIGMPSAVALWAVVMGVMVSASVGIFFGVYPAKKAAMLDPIVALRSEL